MFVLEFFTVYPDSVSVGIIQLNKKLLDKQNIGIILLLPLCHRCHGEMMTSQIKIESENFRCYNQPNIFSRQFSHNSTWTLLKDFLALFISIYYETRTTTISILETLVGNNVDL